MIFAFRKRLRVMMLPKYIGLLTNVANAKLGEIAADSTSFTKDAPLVDFLIYQSCGFALTL